VTSGPPSLFENLDLARTWLGRVGFEDVAACGRGSDHRLVLDHRFGEVLAKRRDQSNRPQANESGSTTDTGLAL
jgi:hypothetical protein